MSNTLLPTDHLVDAFQYAIGGTIHGIDWYPEPYPRKRIRHPALGVTLKNLLELYGVIATWDTVARVWCLRRPNDNVGMPVRRFVRNGESVGVWIEVCKGI